MTSGKKMSWSSISAPTALFFSSQILQYLLFPSTLNSIKISNPILHWKTVESEQTKRSSSEDNSTITVFLIKQSKHPYNPDPNKVSCKCYSTHWLLRICTQTPIYALTLHEQYEQLTVFQEYARVIIDCPKPKPSFWTSFVWRKSLSISNTLLNKSSHFFPPFLSLSPSLSISLAVI